MRTFFLKVLEIVNKVNGKNDRTNLLIECHVGSAILFALYLYIP